MSLLILPTNRKWSFHEVKRPAKPDKANSVKEHVWEQTTRKTWWHGQTSRPLCCVRENSRPSISNTLPRRSKTWAEAKNENWQAGWLCFWFIFSSGNSSLDVVGRVGNALSRNSETL